VASSEKVCIVGAGSSGLTAGQVLGARGIAYDCFEKGSRIGGNWRYENDNGLSSAYRSLHINSSRELMSFRAHPMPDDYPDYPSHEHIARYFDAYAERFGLLERIRFNTEVVEAAPVGDGWEVTVQGADGERETHGYRAVLAGGPPERPDYPTFADGHDEAVIAEAIQASAREGRWVTVDRTSSLQEATE